MSTNLPGCAPKTGRRSRPLKPKSLILTAGARVSVPAIVEFRWSEEPKFDPPVNRRPKPSPGHPAAGDLVPGRNRCVTSLVGTATSSATTMGLGPPARWRGLCGLGGPQTSGSVPTPCAACSRVLEALGGADSRSRRPSGGRRWQWVRFAPGRSWRPASMPSGLLPLGGGACVFRAEEAALHEAVARLDLGEESPGRRGGGFAGVDQQVAPR